MEHEIVEMTARERAQLDPDPHPFSAQLRPSFCLTKDACSLARLHSAQQNLNNLANVPYPQISAVFGPSEHLDQLLHSRDAVDAVCGHLHDGARAGGSPQPLLQARLPAGHRRPRGSTCQARSLRSPGGARSLAEGHRLHRLRWHDLRHTCAALSLSIAPNLSVVKERLGHEDIRTTINIYGHLLPSVDTAFADGLDALYRTEDNVTPLRPEQEEAEAA